MRRSRRSRKINLTSRASCGSRVSSSRGHELARLVTVDGAPADPPSLTTVAPKWEPGDVIPLGRRMPRVIGVRYVDDEPTVLIVEDTSV
jgi:hypothetical protein